MEFTKEKIEQLDKRIEQLFAEKLPPNHFYHDIEHTRRVSAWAKRLGVDERVSSREASLLCVAGLLHDTGYVVRYDSNEPEGARIAGEWLAKDGCTPAEISVVQSLILATSMPQQPVTKLQQIMCDADLADLGLPDQAERGNLLRREWEAIVKGNKYADREWIELQLKFLGSHSYFTDAAQRLFTEGQERALQKYSVLLRAQD